ncbi:MAG: FmdB family zinc ribbon protein [Amnibacterium sp.]
MPTYAYKCRDCETPLEVHQEFSDAPLTVCPTCGGTLRKQYGSVGVTFNGSGFYRTDSRKPESTTSSTAASDSGSSTSKSDSGSAPKTESKPAAKPAAAPAS